MSLKEELELKDNLKHPSAYIDIDEEGEEAKLDGTFTLAEEALGTKGLEMAEKLAVDINNNMNKTVLDIVEDTAKSKDKQ